MVHLNTVGRSVVIENKDLLLSMFIMSEFSIIYQQVNFMEAAIDWNLTNQQIPETLPELL